MTTTMDDVRERVADTGEAVREAVSAPQAPAPDPAAPYGRTGSGRPRRAPLSGKRGRPRGARTSVIGATGQKRPAAAGKKATDYRPGILRLGAMLTFPLAFKAPVDAAVVDFHLQGEDTADNPGIARAISNLANENPQVAAVLDRVLAAGPYAELFGAVMPLAVQLLTNHGRIPVPVATKIGATDPAVIAAQLRKQGEQLAAQPAAG
jgi:hypothetical protein